MLVTSRSREGLVGAADMLRTWYAAAVYLVVVAAAAPSGRSGRSDSKADSRMRTRPAACVRCVR